MFTVFWNSKIIDVYGKEAFLFRCDHIITVIPFDKDVLANGNGSVNDGVNDDVNDGVNDLGKTAQLVYAVMKAEKVNTADEIAKKIQKSEPTVERSIKELKTKNLILRIGSDKTGHWEVL